MKAYKYNTGSKHIKRFLVLIRIIGFYKGVLYGSCIEYMKTVFKDNRT